MCNGCNGCNGFNGRFLATKKLFDFDRENAAVP